MDMPGPINLDPNFKKFIELMNCEKVEYLLLGGYAVNYYGAHRFTADIDFWIAVNPENASRVARVMKRFGFDEAADRKRFLIPNKVHMFGRPPTRIDVLTGPSGIDFTDCWPRRSNVEIDDVKIWIISLADLRVNKFASGRDKDLLDLKMLPTVE